MGERNNNIEYEYECECGMEMKTVEVDVDVDSFRFFPDRRVTLRYGTVQSSVDCLSVSFRVCMRVRMRACPRPRSGFQVCVCDCECRWGRINRGGARIQGWREEKRPGEGNEGEVKRDARYAVVEGWSSEGVYMRFFLRSSRVWGRRYERENARRYAQTHPPKDRYGYRYRSIGIGEKTNKPRSRSSNKSEERDFDKS